MSVGEESNPGIVWTMRWRFLLNTRLRPSWVDTDEGLEPGVEHLGTSIDT